MDRNCPSSSEDELPPLDSLLQPSTGDCQVLPRAVTVETSNECPIPENASKSPSRRVRRLGGRGAAHANPLLLPWGASNEAGSPAAIPKLSVSPDNAGRKSKQRPLSNRTKILAPPEFITNRSIQRRFESAPHAGLGVGDVEENMVSRDDPGIMLPGRSRGIIDTEERAPCDDVANNMARFKGLQRDMRKNKAPEKIAPKNLERKNSSHLQSTSEEESEYSDWSASENDSIAFSNSPTDPMLVRQVQITKNGVHLKCMGPNSKMIARNIQDDDSDSAISSQSPRGSKVSDLDSLDKGVKYESPKSRFDRSDHSMILCATVRELENQTSLIHRNSPSGRQRRAAEGHGTSIERRNALSDAGHILLQSNGKSSTTKKSAKGRAKDFRKPFDSRKHSVAEAFLRELDTQVADGKIGRLAESTGGVKIVWTKTLNTTAGRANWKKEAIRTKQPDGTIVNSGYKHYASIELAEKVIDDEDRLLNVLAHEFCHLCNFMISGITNKPHGEMFKIWAAKCTQIFRDSRSIKVTTKHEYNIDFKYIWECDSCGAEYRRHSRSIDPEKQRCGRCKGRLKQTKPIPRENGGKQTEYQLFVREQMSVVRAENPKSPQKDLMRVIADRWSSRKKTLLAAEANTDDVTARISIMRLT